MKCDLKESDSVRWWSYVVPTEGCWHWTGWSSRDGYGRFQVRTKGPMAHRFGYEMLVGPIPEGLTLDHLCNNPGCVNPEHLVPATVVDNVMRGNGACVRNSKRTHCPKGHPLSGDNLIPSRLPSRGCLTCHREVCRQYMRRKRGAAKEAV